MISDDLSFPASGKSQTYFTTGSFLQVIFPANLSTLEKKGVIWKEKPILIEKIYIYLKLIYN